MAGFGEDGGNGVEVVVCQVDELDAWHLYDASRHQRCNGGELEVREIQLAIDNQQAEVLCNQLVVLALEHASRDRRIVAIGSASIQQHRRGMHVAVQERVAQRRVATEAHGERKVGMAHDGRQEVVAVEFAHPLLEEVDQKHACRSWNGQNAGGTDGGVVRQQQLGQRNVAIRECSGDWRQRHLAEAGIGAVLQQEPSNVQIATRTRMVQWRAHLGVAFIVHRAFGIE
jgi:hypothetical protein